METISLKELESANLLTRKDIKYVFNKMHLNTLIEQILPYYKILEINSYLFSDYQTNYYDTDMLKLYFEHHNGKGNRFKIRIRKYLQSKISVFEIKHKNNKNWTSKERHQIPFNENNIKPYLQNIIQEPLYKSLEVYYSRMSFVSNDFSEKLTLDCDLDFKSEKNSQAFENICIAEIKSKNLQHNLFRLFIKNIGYRPLRISKYCLGIATCYQNIKSNTFKSIISQILILNSKWN